MRDVEFVLCGVLSLCCVPFSVCGAVLTVPC